MAILRSVGLRPIGGILMNRALSRMVAYCRTGPQVEWCLSEFWQLSMVTKQRLVLSFQIFDFFDSLNLLSMFRQLCLSSFVV